MAGILGALALVAVAVQGLGFAGNVEPETTVREGAGGEPGQAGPAGREHGGREGVAGERRAGGRPHVLMIAGGGFVVRDGRFPERTRPFARRAGLRPHYLLPVGTLGSSLTRVREAAWRLADRVGAENVYAYGSSSGGILASILASDGLVRAAVVKAPNPDLLNWTQPARIYGDDYFERIDATPAARRLLSPARRPPRNPILVVQGRDDRLVPPQFNVRYASRFRKVRLRLVEGGHHAERRDPAVMQWMLNWIARAAAGEFGRDR